jgi:hypothetical protein
MKHETLHLNSKRAYVLVNDTWYDTHVDLNPQVGQTFLNGSIEEVLDFASYTAKYPEAKDEMFPYVSEKTVHGGYIRRVVDGLVKYAVNPAIPRIGSYSDTPVLAD